MKMPILIAVLMSLSSPALAQPSAPAQPRTPPAQSGSPMPMGSMMPGQGMMGGMMHGRGMMGRFSSEDLNAFADAHIAALKAGLKLSPEQEKLWPPVEEALRHLARLHLSHMQAMRENRGTMASDPVGLLRSMADNMSQGADGLRKLADAAAPLYAALDEAQKRRLQVLVRMGGRGMMGRGMMGPRGPMMPGWLNDDDDDQDSR